MWSVRLWRRNVESIHSCSCLLKKTIDIIFKRSWKFGEVLQFPLNVLKWSPTVFRVYCGMTYVLTVCTERAELSSNSVQRVLGMWHTPLQFPLKVLNCNSVQRVLGMTYVFTVSTERAELSSNSVQRVLGMTYVLTLSTERAELNSNSVQRVLGMTYVLYSFHWTCWTEF
jgi:hypothetical protein